MAEKPHNDSLGLDGMTLRCSILYIYICKIILDHFLPFGNG